MSSKYDRSITLQCPTCGGTQFEYDAEAEGDEQLVKCPGCGLTISRGDLIQANSENIDDQVNQVSGEVLNDLTKTLRDAFKGNKFIKLK